MPEEKKETTEKSFFTNVYEWMSQETVYPVLIFVAIVILIVALLWISSARSNNRKQIADAAKLAESSSFGGYIRSISRFFYKYRFIALAVYLILGLVALLYITPHTERILDEHKDPKVTTVDEAYNEVKEDEAFNQVYNHYFVNTSWTTIILAILFAPLTLLYVIVKFVTDHLVHWLSLVKALTIQHHIKA